ncbi:MAG TPA: sensor histidine kinase [Rhodanobacter sp.]|nr:sensor histidine kinase [Rhodanobacter sp.]
MFESIRGWFVPAPDSMVAGSVRKGKSPWVDAIHLLWSAWIFITPVFDHFSWRWALLTLLTYPLFLALYAKACLASRRTIQWYALALLAMSMLLMPWYPSGLVYFIYSCVLMNSCRMSLRRYMTVLAGLNAVFLSEAWLLHYPWQAVIWIPVTTFIVGLIVNAERANESKDAELQLSHEEVRRLAATAERERIGRDLHDLLGHTLSLITLKLELSRKLFDRDIEAAKREVTEAEKVARLALAEVRSAVSGIRATDLAAELASARLLLESSRVHFDYEHPPADLPGDIERGLSLILREAATNIARHADASSAKIELVREHASVRMLISDNGRGGINSDGNGLCGMRERVRALGGTLTIESPRGQGTRLKVAVPVPILRLVETSRAPADMATNESPATKDSGQPAA